VFHVSERPTWGKLAKAGSARPDKYLSDIKVAVARLDDLLSAGEIPPPDFVKIDVEGAEVEVLEGARETLARFGPTLIVELHGTGVLLTQVLASIGYCGVPLNEAYSDVAGAHWNATILAFPSGRVESVPFARKLLHGLALPADSSKTSRYALADKAAQVNFNRPFLLCRVESQAARRAEPRRRRQMGGYGCRAGLLSWRSAADRDREIERGGRRSRTDPGASDRPAASLFLWAAPP
jgi:hypothetical protein